MQTHKFIKQDNKWYIELPEYIEKGGNFADLQMVEGADTMLDVMAENKDSIVLSIDRVPFDGADILVLTEKCDPVIGGGYYFLKTYKGQEINHTMWLCQVTEFVFGDLPPEIFIREEIQSQG